MLNTISSTLPLPKSSSALVGAGVRGVRDLDGSRLSRRSGAAVDGRGNMIDRAVAPGLPTGLLQSRISLMFPLVN
ncbi:hypothetical protein ACIQB5_49640 [Streptomyces sp. NPDC088560]|uniref:hypothetical protein n=1 Tax=Streptomyces sp. NPDC088560 TaxID=3365868 RepID=UPI0038232942